MRKIFGEGRGAVKRRSTESIKEGPLMAQRVFWVWVDNVETWVWVEGPELKNVSLIMYDTNVCYLVSAWVIKSVFPCILNWIIRWVKLVPSFCSFPMSRAITQKATYSFNKSESKQNRFWLPTLKPQGKCGIIIRKWKY